MRISISLRVAMAAICVTAVAHAQLERLDPVARRAIRVLPPDWQVVSSNEVGAEQAGRIGQRLGADVRGLSNAVFAVMGNRVQVNTIVAANATEAERLLTRLRGSKPTFTCRRMDETVIEFVGRDENLIRRAVYDLGFEKRPEPLRYRVSMRLAPMTRCRDYMKWNEAVLAIAAAEDATDTDARARRDELLAAFEFGATLTLPVRPGDEYTFHPAPIAESRDATSGLARFQFKDLPRVGAVPYVDVTLTCGAGGTIAPAESAAPRDCVKPTARWPADDPAFRKLAAEITAGVAADVDAVAALLRWLRPNENIRFAGQTGSRYGAAQALRQRHGHCWDFSDCFITLCRAKGIPARQVMGWVFGGQGHVWAEVWIDGRWRPVDPTGGGLIDCAPYHLGYIVSEDGEAPVLYAGLPRIELLNFEQ